MELLFFRKSFIDLRLIDKLTDQFSTKSIRLNEYNFLSAMVNFILN